MKFGTGTIDIEFNGQILINVGNNEIETSFNMLGIEIDPKFNWSNHIAKIHNKVNKAIYLCTISC